MTQSGLPDKVESVKAGQLGTPQKTFFYERRDGSVIALSEMEAGMTGKYYRLLGVSDGKEYFRRMLELQGKVDGLTVEDFSKELQAAFDAELEIATGKTERPRDMSKTDLDGNLETALKI